MIFQKLSSMNEIFKASLCSPQTERDRQREKDIAWDDITNVCALVGGHKITWNFQCAEFPWIPELGRVESGILEWMRGTAGQIITAPDNEGQTGENAHTKGRLHLHAAGHATLRWSSQLLLPERRHRGIDLTHTRLKHKDLNESSSWNKKSHSWDLLDLNQQWD